MPALKFILSIVLLIGIASFSVQNMGSAEIWYYDYKFQLHSIELPLMVVVAIPLVSGFFSAWFIGKLSLFKLKSIIRKQNKSISSLEEELRMLKDNPEPPAQAQSSIDS
jgi:uncharacterized integral membrane protein